MDEDRAFAEALEAQLALSEDGDKEAEQKQPLQTDDHDEESKEETKEKPQTSEAQASASATTSAQILKVPETFKYLLMPHLSRNPQDPLGLRTVNRVELTGFSQSLKPKPTSFKRHDMQGNPIVRILTYNIWFENITQERIDCILEIIQKADADFVCLQEVTDETRTAIMLSDVVKNQYLGKGGSASGNQFIVPYGCIMLSKYKCVYYERYFMSRMGRSLLLAEAPLPINLLVATSHFESLGFSAEVRKD